MPEECFVLNRLLYFCRSQRALAQVLFPSLCVLGAIKPNFWRLLLGVLFLSSLVSCATPGNSNRTSIPVEESKSGGEGSPSASGLISAGKSRSGSAVSSLLKSAEVAYAEQRYESSASFAERAIRVSPRSPQAYFMLAQIRFAQAQIELSQTLSKKAQSLAQDLELRNAITEFMQKTKLNR